MNVRILLRVTLGIVGVLRPRLAARWYGADPGDRRVVRVARVLGARHLAQASALAVWPGPTARALSVAVDLLHGASMVLLAVVRPRLRRPALTSACVAVSLALATLRPRAQDARGRPRVGGSDAASTPADTRAPSDTGENRAIGLGGGAEPDEPPTPDRVEDLERIAERRAAWLTRRTERLEAATTSHPVRPWSPAAAWILLVTGVWLLVGQWLLSLPLTARGDDTALRDSAFAVVVTLAALRLVVARRSNAATGVLVLCGLLLVCAGLFSAHDAARAQGNEIGCGVVVLVATLATLDRRPRTGEIHDEPAVGRADRQPVLSGR
jgi:hypothetical protein